LTPILSFIDEESLHIGPVADKSLDMCHLQMHCNDMIHETLCCEVKQ